MDFMSTVKGSLLENFYPEGWDMAKKSQDSAELGKKIADAICNAECPLENLSLVIV